MRRSTANHTRWITQPAPKWASTSGLHVIDPVGYLEFLGLERDATLVITDSGGVQEETTYLQVPCLTLRANTERPVTISDGTNQLMGENPRDLIPAVSSILEGWKPSGRRPPLWDGQAGSRIARVFTSGRHC